MNLQLLLGKQKQKEAKKQQLRSLKLRIVDYYKFKQIQNLRRIPFVSKLSNRKKTNYQIYKQKSKPNNVKKNYYQNMIEQPQYDDVCNTKQKIKINTKFNTESDHIKITNTQNTFYPLRMVTSKYIQKNVINNSPCLNIKRFRQYTDIALTKRDYVDYEDKKIPKRSLTRIFNRSVPRTKLYQKTQKEHNFISGPWDDKNKKNLSFYENMIDIAF